ncbi:MAG TPA: hypothetical protein VFJ43_16635 [Bacteroidia bacterium]|nr:hypothetical protein [Bacteroidia bacterium]
MKKSKKKNNLNEVNEPAAEYGSREMIFFNSFQEQQAYEFKQLVLLSPEEILQQLRKMINLAYGMHGYNPDKLPYNHTIRIVTPDEHI